MQSAFLRQRSLGVGMVLFSSIEWQTISIWLLAVAVVVIVVLLLLYWPKRQVAHLKKLEPGSYFNAENEARKTLVQIIGGLVVLIGLFFTWRNLVNTQKTTDVTLNNAATTLKMSERGQITERLTRAIDQLGKTDETKIVNEAGKIDNIKTRNIPTRLGGIYALEMIAKENLDYHWQIMEVLTAYVRQFASWTKEGNNKSHSEEINLNELKLEPDIEAVVAVIRRRNWTDKEATFQRLNLSGTNLSEANFVGAVLKGAIFEKSLLLKGVNFTQANLETGIFRGSVLNGAYFNGANLKEADFSGGTKLRQARFEGANLENTVFIDADLENADLRGANINNTKLSNATLKGANLEGVDLSRAFGLTWEQVKSAKIDGQTKLPADVVEQIQLEQKAR